MGSPCKCSDCTKCPYEYCVDENKENDGRISAQHYEAIKRYQAAHRDQIRQKQKERYRYKLEHGICVACREPATAGRYCAKHKLYMQEHNKMYYIQRLEKKNAITT